MAALPLLLRHAAAPPAGGDAALLRRFADRRDGEAFAELVRRHGPAVWRVCRRVVGPAAADDAFQATFLVLATRAKSVRKAASVGSWLVGVAGRVALQMRKAERRRAGGVSPLVLADVPDHRSPDLPDQFRILDEELTRLPDRLRGPVVACLLQGRTHAQAAADLGGSPRTVRRRVDEAKRVLRARLERRGVVPAVAAGLAVGAGEVAAVVPAGLGRRTAAVVFDFLAGGPAATARPAILAHGVATAMLTRKVVLLTATAAVGLSALGAGLAGDGPGDRIPPANVAPAPPGPAPRPPDDPPPASPRYTTANFVVDAPTPELARQVGEAAERHRRALAVGWLDKELPPWPQPCPVKVEVTTARTGGATVFTFGPGGVASQEMKLFGPVPKLLSTVVPHEVAHTVFAAHFGRPLPRWADEGLGVLAESEDEQHAHDIKCREFMNAGRGISLRHLFAMTEYPRDMPVLFAQGYSVCRFLADRDGKAKLLEFVAVGMKDDNRSWEEAAKLVGFESVDALQAAWVASLREPAPRPPAGWREPPRPPVTAHRAGPFAAEDTRPAVARAVAREADHQRAVLAERWFGADPPALDQPCTFRIARQYGGTGTAARLDNKFAGGRFVAGGYVLRPLVIGFTGPWQDELLAETVPAEVGRWLMLAAFGADLPPWAEAGAAAGSVDDPPPGRAADDARRCREAAAAGRLPGLAALFAVRRGQRFPADAPVGQSECVTRFLVDRKGHRAFPRFVRAGLAGGWDAAAREVYGVADLAALEAAWLGWLKATDPSPPAAGDTAPVVPAHRPAVKLSRAGAPATDEHRVESRDVRFDIDYDPARRAGIESLQLWVSQDEGRTWTAADSVSPDKDHVRFEARQDGRYWLTLVTVGRDGTKTPATPAGRPPDLKLVVAVAPPDRVGRIVVEGNTATADRVILAQLGDLYPGALLDHRKLAAAADRLKRLGIFDPDDPPTVEVVPRQDDSNFKDVRVRVKESRTGMLVLPKR